jgi:hypothetical protein
MTTPKKIADNFTNNFHKILGSAIKRYIEIHTVEENFLNTVRQPNAIDRDLLNYQIATANVIQYAKSYIVNEIAINVFQMDNFKQYMKLFRKKSKRLNQTGGQNFMFMLSMIATILITGITNTTSISQSLTPLGEQNAISFNFETSEIPQARRKQSSKINPRIEEHMEQATRTFDPNAVFPSNQMFSANVQQLYSKDIVNRIKKSMPILSFFLSNQNYIQRFQDIIRSKVEEINLLLDATHSALEEMCTTFIGRRDERLPVDYFTLINARLADRYLEMKREYELRIQEETDKRVEAIVKERSVPQNAIYTFIPHSHAQVTSSVSGPRTEVFLHGQDLKQQDLETISRSVEDSIKDEMPEISSRVGEEITQKYGTQAFENVHVSQMEGLERANLQTYFKGICKIKKTHYIFNEENGELYIRDPARSRFHLQVLAQNVLTYHDMVSSGLTIVNNGQISKDMPNDERIRNFKILAEKAEAILDILTEYDVEVARTLSGEEINADVFFRNIGAMWIKLRDDMKRIAIDELPITQAKTREAAEKKRQQRKQQLTEEEEEQEFEKQQLEQREKSRKLQEKGWRETQLGVAVKTRGIIGLFSSSIIGESVNTVVDSAADIGNNGIENLNMLFTSGMSSITSVAWGVLGLSMILFFPCLLVICLRTGCVTSAVKRIKGKMDKEEKTDNQLTVVPKSDSYKKSDKELLEIEDAAFNLGQTVLQLEDNPDQSRSRGRSNVPLLTAPPSGNSGGYRKTRKNRKHKTRKSKPKNIHYTRHKNRS